MKTIKKISEKSKDFIGWKSEDSLLEVVDFYGRDLASRALYKVTCTECSKDPELFPDGHFVTTKANLIRGVKPCGCSKTPKWKDWQYLILARRAGGKKGFIVHGFTEEFHGHQTKLNLECRSDGHKWIASITSVINNGSGCPKCASAITAEQLKIPEYIALQKCIEICKHMDYDIIGFTYGYKNNTSCFEYICKMHGKQSVSYNKFVNMENRCPRCAEKVRLGSGFYMERKDEKDYLYVLDFNNEFIKVGRSFVIDERIRDLKKPSCSGIKNIIKLRVYTATHHEIWDLEQRLLDKLRGMGFQYPLNWTNECFDKDCLFVLNEALDSCGLERVY